MSLTKKTRTAVLVVLVMTLVMLVTGVIVYSLTASHLERGVNDDLAALVENPKLDAVPPERRYDALKSAIVRDLRYDARHDRVYLERLVVAFGIGFALMVLLGFVMVRLMQSRDRALEELGTLTDNIAHDLRTPLTRLRLAAETLRKEDSKGRLAPLVEEECSAMLDMIGTMLDISQTDFRINQTPREEIELNGFLQALAELYQPSFEDKGIRFALRLPAKRITFSAHRGKLQQLVGNLLDNALKYTQAGGQVELMLRPGPVIIVQDTGCGIAPEDVPHVFTRFWRADSSRNQPGNGLGLALVKAIATSYGGRVKVESEPGKGSVFTVLLNA